MNIGRKIQVILMIATAIAFMLLMRPVVAQETPSQGGAPQATATQAPQPKPDPAGIATGDKTNALDAAGNAFVVTEPTDTKAPDYA